MKRLGLVVLAAGCATPGPTPGFREVAPERPAVPASELFNACYREGAAAGLTLTFHPGDVVFEAEDNSTGRCVREIAASYPWGSDRPPGELKVRLQPPSGWAVLAWVKLLSATRFGPERGLLDPAAVVAACLSRGRPRPGVSYAVRYGSALQVSVLPSGALTDAERCVEAALGATAWPSAKAFTLEFSSPPPSTHDVSFYFGDDQPVVPLDPQRVHDAMALLKPKVAACWESALERRAGLSGGRTVRITVADDGSVTRAVIAANATDARATAADYVLDQCLVSAVRTGRFGPGAGDTAYSWIFGDRAG